MNSTASKIFSLLSSKEFLEKVRVRVEANKVTERKQREEIASQINADLTKDGVVQTALDLDFRKQYVEGSLEPKRLEKDEGVFAQALRRMIFRHSSDEDDVEY